MLTVVLFFIFQLFYNVAILPYILIKFKINILKTKKVRLLSRQKNYISVDAI